MMKTLNVLILSLLVTTALAQTQLPESGFNDWTASSTNTFFEPTGGWWTTLNTLSSLGGPVTVSPSTDAHSGNYAAQLETKLWGTFIITGLLVSGEFGASGASVNQGKPFTDMPSRFKAWCKYTSVNSDSAGMVALLTKFNTATGQADTIATAIDVVKNNIPNYTQLDIEFDYKITGINPDTIVVLFTSSGDGGNFQGQIGSTFLVDDVTLEYTNGLQESLLPEFRILVFPSPASDQISFEFNTAYPTELFCHIYSIDGRLVETFTPSGNKHQVNVSSWPQGKYILQAYMGNSLSSTTKFVVNH